MSGGRTVRALVAVAPGHLEVREVPDRALDAGCVRVDTLASGVSMGTEQTFYRGTNPALHSSLHPELGVFQPGTPAQTYPVERFGYMQVGRVVASRVEHLPEGLQVAMAYGHRTGHTADALAERVVPLPAALPARQGVLVAHLGPICANGLLHAAHELCGPDVRALGDGVRGRVVAVTGGGLIGLLTGYWAKVLGAAEVTVVDPTPQRRAAAETLGLTALDDSAGDAGEQLARRHRHGPGDRGADVVLQCRGRAPALHTALRCLRPQGAVVDLAFYDDDASGLRLGEEFHHNGLTLRCAQIGRVPRGLAHTWDRERLSRETLDLLADHGALLEQVLLTDDVAWDDAPQLFADVAAHRRHVLGTVLMP